MELRASFDAWLHTECNLTFMDVAEYTPQELTRLKLGYLVREDPGNVRGSSGGGAASRRVEIRKNQQQARRDMMQDLGFD